MVEYAVIAYLMVALAFALSFGFVSWVWDWIHLAKVKKERLEFDKMYNKRFNKHLD